MTIIIMAAVAKNGVIGSKGQLPWHMSADLKHFRELSVGKPIIMGHSTFLSLGKPLPKRRNIVLSRVEGLSLKGCEVADSLNEALALVKDETEVIIGGGASVYQQFLPRADKMYLTFIHADFEGDAFFPEYNRENWQEVERENYSADKDNPYPYSFVTLERKK